MFHVEHRKRHTSLFHVEQQQKCALQCRRKCSAQCSVPLQSRQNTCAPWQPWLLTQQRLEHSALLALRTLTFQGQQASRCARRV